MFRPAFRALALGALASACAFGDARAFFIDDTGVNAYWGGDLFGGSPTTGDIVGNSSFEIFNATVDRVGTTFRVVISTNYNPLTSTPGGTGFGTLFIGPGPFTPTGTGNHPGDTFLDGPGRFSHVLVFPHNPALIPGVGGGGTADLKPLVGDGSDVQLSFPPPPFGPAAVRNDQAVGYTGGAATLLSGSWSFVDGPGSSPNTLTFQIFGENGLFGSDVTIAWAMTCANDVIAGSGAPGIIDEVPLPAGFILMGSMLLGAGGVAKWRSRRERRRAA
jgi:hypothetical protein